MGDRVIDATRQFLRSNRRRRIQASLYTVDGHELSGAQIEALEVIEREEGIRMSQLAAQIGLDPSTVTRTVNPLVELGLVERFTDPGNRRSVVVRCTESGTEANMRVIEERRAVMRETLAPMEPGRRLLLADLLDEHVALMDGYRTAAEDPAE